MSAKTIYFFPDSDSPTIEQVGGKGFSLIQGSQAKLPVPPGFILSVNYFIPWFSELKKTKTWSEFLQPEKYDLEKSCSTLKKYTQQLSFTKQQTEELSEALKTYNKKMLFAVRSSSPEEDLEGASFAGGYETVLGVSSQNMHHAIKKAFASCLDYRITVYKKENSFDITNPKIAVIIQEQIASEIAGVGFSLNPITNNFDEAVFNANWGLGETVVSGTVTPDTFIVYKNALKITDKELGKKEQALYLTPTGGTKEKKDNHTNEFTLTDNQLIELTKLIVSIEELYKKPVDIEWAYAKDILYLLQVRPITTFIPLPQSMLTTPGEKKRLYLDFTIVLQGMYQPLSVSATSFFKLILGNLGKRIFFRDIMKNMDTAIPWITTGRMYINLSNIFKLTSKKKIVNFLQIIDPLSAKTIDDIQIEDYISSTNKLKLLPIGISILFPRFAFQIFKAKKWPEKTHQQSQKRLADFMKKARTIVNDGSSYSSSIDKLINIIISDILCNTVPLFILGKSSLSEMKTMAGKNLEHAFAPLEVALPNNVTTQMGLDLYSIFELLPKNLNQNEIQKGIETNSLPQPFMSAWKNFIAKYGHRGPKEIDLAVPRYRDDPKLLISILFSMKDTNEQDNPKQKFKNNQKKSQIAYEYLYNIIKKRSNSQAKQFQKLYKIFQTFTGYRETHKFYLVFVIDLLRQRLLKNATTLFTEGRLQTIEQIFDLSLEELDKANSNQSFNLIEHAKENRKFIDRLTRVSHLPSVIDSRGLIHLPSASITYYGETIGTPISAGVVQGLIKVLHTPTEKPFLKGEILVARATDPGWTPLFINASAIILEVGGILQHGALVAREYGLPCVAGVANATSLWKDGTLVKVNGSTGIITLITKS